MTLLSLAPLLGLPYGMKVLWVPLLACITPDPKTEEILLSKWHLGYNFCFNDFSLICSPAWVTLWDWSALDTPCRPCITPDPKTEEILLAKWDLGYNFCFNDYSLPWLLACENCGVHMGPVPSKVKGALLGVKEGSDGKKLLNTHPHCHTPATTLV